MKNILNNWVNASNPQRLELVFENRNRDYGAYIIRQNQANYQVYAMLITFGLGLLFFGGYKLFREFNPPAEKDGPIILSCPTIINREIVFPEVELDKPATGGAQHRTFSHTTPIINGNAVFDPETIDLSGTPGLKNINGEPGLFGEQGSGLGLGTDSGTVLFPKPPRRIVNLKCRFNHKSLSINEFIQTEFILPESCPFGMRTAAVTVSFVVDENGAVGSFSIEDETKSCKAVTQEILRILKLTSWIPANKNGVPVKSYHRIPIVLDVEQF